jgi:hypothetical protein
MSFPVILPLSAALRITRLSASRYYSWCRAEIGCELDDQPGCPRVVPTRLTPAEIENVQRMVESDDHRHMSLRALALHAQRIVRVLASPSTWYRLVDDAQSDAALQDHSGTICAAGLRATSTVEGGR